VRVQRTLVGLGKLAGTTGRSKSSEARQNSYCFLITRSKSEPYRDLLFLGEAGCRCDRPLLRRDVLENPQERSPIAAALNAVTCNDEPDIKRANAIGYIRREANNSEAFAFLLTRGSIDPRRKCRGAWIVDSTATQRGIGINPLDSVECCLSLSPSPSYARSRGRRRIRDFQRRCYRLPRAPQNNKSRVSTGQRKSKERGTGGLRDTVVMYI